MAVPGAQPNSILNQITSTASNIVSYLRLPVLASSGIAAVLSGLLYFKQNELIYPRNIPLGSRTEVPRPPQFGITDFEELSIPTPDGESLSAFFIRPSNRSFANNVTLLMFHGNAGNIGHRLPIARVLEESIGCNVLMLQYRGYGLSTGSPSEQGLLIDGQTGLDYLRNRAETANSKIVIYGQSLGGALSIQLAAKNHAEGDIAGLILENTFTSMRKLIPSAFPPARYLARLCHQVWPSETFLPEIESIPILFLSGLQDEIVPPSHMRHLYTISRAKTKIWKSFPQGTHNDTVAERGYFDAIAEFIDEHVLLNSRSRRRFSPRPANA
ncbi:alpha/beta-hydrolase [Xylona heveae TC161]|uniref:Alpha/beta-hydrolase n=1 Tax=Xylona heveae (strain CBS 132557 / TC161) TaxID=1328760 RepID=A0A165JYE6_XYLHT|nr:alpha/beta-hydrolase [Xylona heveae TC161]KZF26783.1 alpha/beta-hydrolase [Xylona heveae TC161]